MHIILVPLTNKNRVRCNKALCYMLLLQKFPDKCFFYARSQEPYFNDAKNTRCATWNKRKRGRLNERFKCLWSGLISREPLDHRWIYRLALFEKKSASTNRRLPQKGGGPFEDFLDHIPGDSVKTVFHLMTCFRPLC